MAGRISPWSIRASSAKIVRGLIGVKKILALTLTFASLGIFTSSVQASADKSSNLALNNSPDPQVRIQIGQDRYGRRYRRGARSYRTSRIVRYGRRLYRETYLVTYLPNGRTRTTLIDRDRIG